MTEVAKADNAGLTYLVGDAQDASPIRTDMGAAFGVALLGICILVVAQFGSFRLPLVILTPIPLTFLGIMAGHWLFVAPFSATLKGTGLACVAPQGRGCHASAK